jgi:hypothetical protein
MPMPLYYATDLMEAYPDDVVPTVLFTDRNAWRKDVPRFLESRLGGTAFLHLVFIRKRPFFLLAASVFTIIRQRIDIRLLIIV